MGGKKTYKHGEWFKGKEYPVNPQKKGCRLFINKIEDLLIIKLKRPMFAPYFDYIWTGSEMHDRGKKVREIVIDVESSKHREFIREVLNERGSD